MKKIGLLFIILCLSTILMTGCEKAVPTQGDQQGLESDKVTSMPSPWPSQLDALVSKQVAAINDRDPQSYMETINPSNSIYYNESDYFSQKLTVANFSDFKKRIVSAQKMSDTLYLAQIEQSYAQNGQVNQTTYPAKYIFANNLWFDDDVAFDVKMIDQLKLLTMTDIENPTDFIEAVKKSLATIHDTFPEPLTGLIEIKLYSDQELLRQTTDLGIEWLFTGWSEANHAIKAYTGQPSPYNYEGLFTHELIHKLTLSVSKSNLPLWFAEGLATHYGSNAVAGGTYIDMGKSNSEDMRVSLLDLQRMNLETLPSREEVMAYYGASAMIVKYLSETYGDSTVFKLYQALGQYPANDINSAKHYELANKRMSEVLQKVLKLSDETLSSDYMNWYNDQYPQ